MGPLVKPNSCTAVHCYDVIIASTLVWFGGLLCAQLCIRILKVEHLSSVAIVYVSCWGHQSRHTQWRYACPCTLNIDCFPQRRYHWRCPGKSLPETPPSWRCQECILFCHPTPVSLHGCNASQLTPSFCPIPSDPSHSSYPSLHSPSSKPHYHIIVTRHEVNEWREGFLAGSGIEKG